MDDFKCGPSEDRPAESAKEADASEAKAESGYELTSPKPGPRKLARNAPTLTDEQAALVADAVRALSGEDETRYSLRGLFVLIALAAVLLAIGRALPRPIFAGLAGLATLVGIVVLTLLQTRSALAHVGWWLLLFIYLLAIGLNIWG